MTTSTGVHEKFEFTPRTIIAMVLTCICALLANAAGIGGGPIYLPLLMVFPLQTLLKTTESSLMYLQIAVVGGK